MTDPTSDEDDHADYTDDHREERKIDRIGSDDDIRDVAPDVLKGPDQETPD